jgi:hypothetical protein
MHRRLEVKPLLAYLEVAPPSLLDTVKFDCSLSNTSGGISLTAFLLGFEIGAPRNGSLGHLACMA